MKKKKFLRYFSFFMALNIIFEVISPTMAMALTNGPNQPEFTGFEPANSSEMVDLFTGDFKYNIPLMDVDGYPVNIAYHAGPNMDAEASWVGLGWNLNPGVLNRMVKGLPDDFNGESIHSVSNIKPMTNMGVGFMASAWLGANLDYELVGVGGKIGVDGQIVLSYNDYKGYGLEVEMDANASLTRKIGPISMTDGAGVGMTLSSQDGGTLSENFSHGVQVNFALAGVGINAGVTMGEGSSINTRSGAATKTYFASGSVGAGAGGISGSVGFSISHTLPTGPVSYAPKISNDFVSSGFGLSIKAGLWGKAHIDLPPIPTINLNGGYLIGFKGYYTRQTLKDKKKITPGYGYLYAENAGENSLMDFNRFRDGALFQETPNISMAQQMYDIYSASAQGMGSNFRPFRSDNGIVHDGVGETSGKNSQAGTEIGGILIFHLLMDYSNVNSSGRSGGWDTYMTNLSYQNKDIKQAANRFYEKYYFKSMGEISARDGGFDGGIGGEAPVKPVLAKVGEDYHAFSPISGNTRSRRDIRNNYIQSLTGAEAMKYGYQPNMKLYASGALTVDQDTRLVSSTVTTVNRLNKTVVAGPNTFNVPTGHHMSEISMTNANGSKYVYGIPVYNLGKKRVMFNASAGQIPAYPNGWPTTNYTQNALNKSVALQMVSYTAGDLANNLRGKDNFYRSDSTPPYASAFLLNTILSPDYVDVTGDGPTYDDLGSFTKFNYSKKDDYTWREPFCAPSANSLKESMTPSKQANYEKGMVADDLDDKAFYEYGVRENYYLHSIETKNNVAFFETTDRTDAAPAKNEDGDINTSNTNLPQKLESIKLYSKTELLANPSSPTPIKTVRFDYDYSLCPGTFNSASQGGKLTLNKIFFSYGNSEKSALSPYEFTYTQNANFAYNPKAVDRWGNYKPNIASITGETVVTTLNNIEFPYATQNKANADSYAEAWNLTEIKTPSGSTIKVNYESDDYGYIQNEQAGQMIKIVNCLSVVNPTAMVGNHPIGNNIKDNDILIVDMLAFHRGIQSAGSGSLTPSQATNYIKQNIIKMNKKLYYKCFMKLAEPACALGIKKNYYDFLPGYAEVLDAGVFSNPADNFQDGAGKTCYRYAYVRLKKEIAYESKEVNPISYAGWDYLRNFLPQIAYPGSEPANMGDGNNKPLKQFKSALAGLGVALADFVNGVSGKPNKRFYKKNFCNSMDYNKSFIRAYVPHKQKLGGGYRVKKLVTEDRWDQMIPGESKTTYGQVYDYRIKEGRDTISSGVAMYEPIVGGDEISLRQPIDMVIEKKFAPNDHLFQEEPLGEMLYPSPLVGYSKVTVTTLPDPGAITAPTVCLVGKTDYEFYTAKDFPIIYRQTGLDQKLLENDLIQDFMVVPTAIKIMHASQGQSIKMNDMHGKLKAISTYGQDDMNSAISGTKYTYKQSGGGNGSRQLITSVRTINEKNVIGNDVMSRDIDITTDTKENISESETIGDSFLLEIGIDLSLTTFLISVDVNNTAIYSDQKVGCKSATITKVIQQYGILDMVESFDERSKTTTKNLLWDRNTGEVVLTSVTNNFDQTVYNFNYPAYWMYPQMGHEFRRDGIELLCPASQAATIWDVGTGVLQKSAVINPLLLTDGDEVMIMNQSGTRIGGRYWIQFDYVSYIANNSTQQYFLLDENGTVQNTVNNFGLSTSGNYIIKLINPVNENNLGASAGMITSRGNPAGGSINYATGTSIIDAKMQEFCTAPSFFLTNAVPVQTLTNISPNVLYSLANPNAPLFNTIISGYQGTMRPSLSYAFHVDRNYATDPNVKQDGFYSSFSPFWTYVNNAPSWAVNPNLVSNWKKMNNTKYYSPYGEFVEGENSIFVPYAERYGFNHTLPALKANNAKVDEVGFDSFEEYNPTNGGGGSVYTSLGSIVLNQNNINNNDYLGFYGQVTSGAGPSFNGTDAHTGRTSLSFGSGQTINLTHDLNKFYQFTPVIVNDGPGVCQPVVLNLSKLNFTSGALGKKYYVSMWVKGQTPSLNYSNLVNFNVTGILSPSGTSPIPVTLTNPGSPIINGWQKLDYEFTVGGGPVQIQLQIKANGPLILDDFRVQPYNANMVCNVYDPFQHRLWAQLDDRNFATIMEYDNEGMLVRKNKETQKGLYTTQESRKSTVKP